jgi:ABC-2 type transport system permease protein
MNLYIKEFKSSVKPLIIWLICLILFIGAGMAKYISFAKQEDIINELMSSMPFAFRKAMSLNILNLTKVLDYYAYMFSFVMLFSAVYAMKLGATIIIKEESYKTIEFLATKPIGRKQIITSKIFCAITNIAIFDIMLLFASFIILESVKVEAYNIESLISVIFPFFIFQLIYFFVGMFISIKLKSIKKSTTYTLGVVMITYLLSVVSNLTTGFGFIKYVSPFKYFEPVRMFHVGLPDPIYFVISGIIIVMCTVSVYILYENKDFI